MREVLRPYSSSSIPRFSSRCCCVRWMLRFRVTLFRETRKSSRTCFFIKSLFYRIVIVAPARSRGVCVFARLAFCRFLLFFLCVRLLVESETLKIQNRGYAVSSFLHFQFVAVSERFASLSSLSFSRLRRHRRGFPILLLSRIVSRGFFSLFSLSFAFDNSAGIW
jgi:hypothetical protein